MSVWRIDGVQLNTRMIIFDVKPRSCVKMNQYEALELVKANKSYLLVDPTNEVDVIKSKYPLLSAYSLKDKRRRTVYPVGGYTQLKSENGVSTVISCTLYDIWHLYEIDTMIYREIMIRESGDK